MHGGAVYDVTLFRAPKGTYAETAQAFLSQTGQRSAQSSLFSPFGDRGLPLSVKREPTVRV